MPQNGPPRPSQLPTNPSLTAMSASHSRPDLLDGRYEVGALIGRGGTSRVYTAFDKKRREHVAIKLLNEKLMAKTSMRRRFDLEIAASMSVAHPNVVQAFGHGVYHGRPYLVMELVEGSSVAHELSDRGPLKMNSALLVAKQTARALCALHQEGIVHRDVTPGNLLLSYNEAGLINIKLADFGIVRLEQQSITASGAAVGTSAFMAPEQVLGETVDCRTDVYSLGLVLFTMLCGTVPHGGTSKQQLAHQLTSPTPPISWFVDEPAQATATIVSCAVRKSPLSRYQTMAAMLADIERALGDSPGEPSGWPQHEQTDRYLPTTAAGQWMLDTLLTALDH